MDMSWFVEFFAKYWLTIVFGLIAAWLGKKAKHYKELLDKEKETQKQAEFSKVIADIKDYVDEKFQKIEDQHEKLYKAVFDVQQKQFQRDCYEYLQSDRGISLEEFKNLYTDYNIYTSLGGNGIGSMLFEKVEEKYSTQLMTEKILDAAIEKTQQISGPSTTSVPPVNQVTAASPPPQIIRIYDPPQRPVYHNPQQGQHEAKG